MRLGIIRQRYTPFGGAERFVERAMDALVARGVQVRVYTRKWPQDRTGSIEPVICNPFYLGSLWRDASFASAVRAALARDRPDIVQSHERIEGCDIFRAGDGVHRVWLEERLRTGGRGERARIAANPYHRYMLDAEARMFASPALKAVICISQMVKRRCAAPFHAARRQAARDLQRRRSARVQPGRARRIGPRRARSSASPTTTSRSCWSARTTRARAWRRPSARSRGCPAPRASSSSAGTSRPAATGGSRTAPAWRTASSSPGRRPDPRPFLGAADAFVLPTLYDPLSNAVLEALACGLPVVTSTRCGAGELVVAHDAGWTCDATDDAAFAERMQALLDPALRAQRGAAALTAVAALTPENMTRRMLDLYGALLGRPGLAGL